MRRRSPAGAFHVVEGNLRADLGRRQLEGDVEGTYLAAMWRLLRRVDLLLWRALRLRCPNCGGGPIFDSWLRMRGRCPRCGFFPFSKTLFLAFDLVFRPPSPEEFVPVDAPGRP